VLLCVSYKVRGQDNKGKNADYQCPEGLGQGNFADPATCRRFYQLQLLLQRPR